MAMVDSFSRTGSNYGTDVPEMRESRRKMLTELEDAIQETTAKIRAAGPYEDTALLDTLAMLAEIYDVVKNGGK